MFKTSLLSLPLIAALSIAAAPVLAADYYIVVPAPGKGAPYAAIQLELSPANLPAGWVGGPYAGFDFNTALQITGDAALDMSLVTWSAYAGALPEGLTLTKEGSVSGTPTVAGTSSFQVLARYRTKSAVGTYAVEVTAERHLVEQAGVRSWEDGTFAQSCLEYRQPTQPYVYAGATGDGTYRIAPNGQAPFDAYCDMTSEGGGWTRVVRQTETQPVGSWEGGTNGASYTLTSAKIPTHTQTAFGKNGQATYVDYVNFVYTTGLIAPAQVATSPKTGRSYHIYRHSSYYYSNHDPDNVLYTTGLRAEWRYTLTFDVIGSYGNDWTFSPWADAEGNRGLAIGGAYLPGIDGFAWTVWVR
ncbi:fibrinogen-like YCDxxxxGGGW domain-containing protein [Castellaniella sp. GW247-6E4]|uniref:fibrinogen-like YCDxxxxGGGW domain-containing protein n=1 Tax=Castellaniella sp. GW247-6E4 TaxID=3140380 RepID=UPI003314E55A